MTRSDDPAARIDSGPLLDPADRPAITELAPLLRRVVSLDRHAVVRIRLVGDTATAFARVPFGVLVGRAVQMASAGDTARARADRDLTLEVADTLAWVDERAGDAVAPSRRDDAWRGALPPSRGWVRIETVPDGVVRRLVRQGALALKEGAERDGAPGAQPRAGVADALLDTVVLTVTPDRDAHVDAVPVDLRTLSALTRMGFLQRGGAAHVDVAGRWVRVAAGYGSVYAERPGGLTLLSPSPTR